jgi:replicative DNA helicase
MIENTILSNLISNEDYGRKTIPYLRSEYFTDNDQRIIFGLIEEYVKKYNKFPNKEALSVDLHEISGLTDHQFAGIQSKINELQVSEVNEEWLLDNTEKFCQDKAIYNAIMDSIRILDDKSGKTSKGMIPDVLTKALSVSFDTHIGHDFIDDADSRFEFYHRTEVRIPFDLEYFNKITKGGVPKKTLNIALAGTGVGKSLFMCHCAAANLTKGNNVLYITLEMAEEKIAERIDANLLDVTIDELSLLPKESYDKKMSRLKEKTKGKLIIKEYPTASAGSGNFRHLLNELKMKKDFIPDVIYIDYLNICSSSRLKYGANVNSYTYVKAIAEELRGLAVEFNVPIFSATQTTRSGFSNSDVGLEDTSESFGLPATADFMFALISTDELHALNQMMVKQLKNRFADPSINKRFVIGVDRARMKLYDVEQSAQDDVLIDDTPLMDQSPFGQGMKAERKPSFDGFK